VATVRTSKRHGLSHVDAANQPIMVPVGAKAISHRSAEAEALVQLPAAVALALRRSGHRTRKGPVFDAAIIAGVMAAKSTASIIPFCHPLPLEHCHVAIVALGARTLRVRCRVETHHKTGVEMEALMGAAAAALTIYDMCKALSHAIRITGVRLLTKTGGRRNVGRRRSAS
jgi:cyclic pyranopterin monophosphate synthase